MARQSSRRIVPARAGYTGLVGDIAGLLESARRASARAVNTLMTATYWEVGRRIVEFELGGRERAEYGEELMDRLAVDLTREYGRGFSRRNLQNMRQFFLAFSVDQIRQTLSGKSLRVPLQTTHGESTEPIMQTLSAQLSSADRIRSTPSNVLASPQIWQTPSAKSPPEIFQTPSGISPQPTFALRDLARAFPLPWSHYVLLLGGARSPEAQEFYHVEALRGGWSVRQLRRQIDSQFYERTALSRNKAKMHLYLNYAREHWTQPGEHAPVGLILCSGKGESLVRYATNNLPNKVVVREYLTALPNEKRLAAEIGAARKRLEARR